MASSANNPIGWCDRTWNPVRGCSRVSPGCDNCYAMNQAHRFSGPDKPFEGLTTLRKGKVDWSGRVRLVSDALDLPLRTRKPARFFVNSMSDLFHPALKDEQIDRVFGAMWASLYIGRRNPIEGHVFQVLTKRADRMRDYLSIDRRSKWAQHAGAMCEDGDAVHDQTAFREGPHPRIWLGVSCEDQQRADERIPHLLQTPAAVRFVSAEPLLGPIDFAPLWFTGTNGIDWVIAGGEAGARARPCDVLWLERIAYQCKSWNVACYIKQLGTHVRDRNDVGFDGEDGDKWHLGPRLFDAVVHDPDGVREEYQGAPVRVRLLDRAGKDPAEWPKMLRIRQFPESR